MPSWMRTNYQERGRYGRAFWTVNGLCAKDKHMTSSISLDINSCLSLNKLIKIPQMRQFVEAAFEIVVLSSL